MLAEVGDGLLDLRPLGVVPAVREGQRARARSRRSGAGSPGRGPAGCCPSGGTSRPASAASATQTAPRSMRAVAPSSLRRSRACAARCRSAPRRAGTSPSEEEGQEEEGEPADGTQHDQGHTRESVIPAYPLPDPGWLRRVHATVHGMARPRRRGGAEEIALRAISPNPARKAGRDRRRAATRKNGRIPRRGPARVFRRPSVEAARLRT